MTLIGLYAAIESVLQWKWRPKYANRAEMEFRKERFPSVEDRVRLYMGHWFKPPCSAHDQIVYQRIQTKEENSSKNNATSIRYGVADLVSSMLWPISMFLGREGSATGDVYYAIRELDSGVSQFPQRTIIIPKTIGMGRMFYVDRDELRACRRDRWSIRFYCSDGAASMLDEALPGIGWKERDDPLPLICQFSDETVSYGYDAPDLSILQANPRIPHIKKIRLAMSQFDLDQLTADDGKDGKHCHEGPRSALLGMNNQLQPIIWLLNIKRHFKYSQDIRRYDVPWTEKKDTAVFRGLLTGLDYDKDASDDENCRRLVRCKLVYEHAHSDIVDAKLTATFDKVPEIFHGVNLTGPELLKEEMLQYKGFIILEGYVIVQTYSQSL
jgi:hypothetical protein